MLSSYTSRRFLHFLRTPLLPLGSVYVIDECLHCGQRGLTSNRKYKKQRKQDLAWMMETFSQQADNPDTVLHGLQTLMTYNEEHWFMDVQKTYGARFYDHMLIQFVIAQALCRFGHYAEAKLYCRVAIVLGAGRQADELMELCHRLSEQEEFTSAEQNRVNAESMLRPFAFLITVAACGIIALALFGFSAANRCEARLISGTSTPYSVEIDARPYRVEPFSITDIKLRLGKHTMRIVDIAGCTNSVAFEYTAPLLKQKLHKLVLVLNPDAMALLTAKSTDQSNPAEFNRHSSTLYILDHISNFFIPDTEQHLQNIGLIQETSGIADACSYAQRVLTFEPEGRHTKELLTLISEYLQMEQAIEFLRSKRDAPAPRLLWHLAYQDLMMANQPSSDALQNEYAKRCKADPDEPLNYFLLGRILPNRENAKLLFEKSEKEQGCGGLGYYAIARDLLCKGDFTAALPYSEKALSRDPANPEFIDLNLRAHLALREYDRLLPKIRKKEEAEPSNPKWISQEITYLTLLGQHHEAISAANRSASGDEQAAHLFHAAQFYAVGNATDYCSSLALAQTPDATLQQLLYSDRITAAHELLPGIENHDYTEHLLLYAAACRNGLSKIAADELAEAIEQAGRKTIEQKTIIAMLSTNAPPSETQLRELRIWPQEKAILCTALGFRFPEQQELCFRLARQFNHTPEHPQLLLKKWTAQSTRSR